MLICVNVLSYFRIRVNCGSAKNENLLDLGIRWEYPRLGREVQWGSFGFEGTY